MKIAIHSTKPRNPLVAAAQFRRAGSHRPQTGVLRKQASRHLKHELDQLSHSKDSP